MFVRLNEVPSSDRHLLFCSDPRINHPELDQPILLDHLAAINRSLAIHGEHVDHIDLLSETTNHARRLA